MSRGLAVLCESALRVHTTLWIQPPCSVSRVALSETLSAHHEIRYAQKWETVGFGYRNLSIRYTCTSLHLEARRRRGSTHARDRARRDRQHATPCVLARRGGMRAAFRSCTVWASS